MKKELASKFAFLAPVATHLVATEFIEEESSSKVESPLDMILNEIFAVDPVSGFPKGDLTYYLTENGNPQVKEWIQRNLLQPRSVLTGADSQKVSDDLIAEFSRQSGESIENYAARLAAIRSEAEENLRKFQSENE